VYPPDSSGGITAPSRSPVFLNSRVGGIVSEGEEVIELLERNRYSFDPGGVRALMESYNLKLREDFYALAQVVVEEGFKRMATPLNKLWDILGIPSLPEVEKSLKDGKTVRVWCVRPATKGQECTEVSIAGGLGSGPSERHRFPFPDFLPENLDVTAGTGWVTLYAPSGLVATNGRAFFKTNNQSDLEKALETAKILRPVLLAMDLPDIDDAFRELEKMKHGETRMEGSYVLARTGSYWILRRGLILGDPQLDGVLLADQEVGLSFSEKMEIIFRFYWWREQAYLDYVRFRFGEETVHLWKNGLSSGYVLDLDPVTKVIRSRIEQAFDYHERTGCDTSLKKASPKMLAFLRAFAEHENPFQALAEGKLHRHIVAELFSEI